MPRGALSAQFRAALCGSATGLGNSLLENGRLTALQTGMATGTLGASLKPNRSAGGVGSKLMSMSALDPMVMPRLEIDALDSGSDGGEFLHLLGEPRQRQPPNDCAAVAPIRDAEHPARCPRALPLLPGERMYCLVWAEPPYQLISATAPWMSAFGVRVDDFHTGRLTIDVLAGTVRGRCALVAAIRQAAARHTSRMARNSYDCSPPLSSHQEEEPVGEKDAVKKSKNDATSNACESVVAETVALSRSTKPSDPLNKRNHTGFPAEVLLREKLNAIPSFFSGSNIAKVCSVGACCTPIPSDHSDGRARVVHDVAVEPLRTRSRASACIVLLASELRSLSATAQYQPHKQADWSVAMRTNLMGACADGERSSNEERHEKCSNDTPTAGSIIPAEGSVSSSGKAMGQISSSTRERCSDSSRRVGDGCVARHCACSPVLGQGVGRKSSIDSTVHSGAESDDGTVPLLSVCEMRRNDGNNGDPDGTGGDGESGDCFGSGGHGGCDELHEEMILRDEGGVAIDRDSIMQALLHF